MKQRKFLKRKKKDALFYLGFLLLGFWLADSIDKIFVLHAPLRLIWYSSVGLGLTVVALLSENTYLIAMAACSLVFIEGFWIIGFFSTLLLNKHIPGVAEYMFAPGFPTREFIISLYHLFLVPTIVLAVFQTKPIHRFGWVGASLLALVVGLLTYRFAAKTDNINCVHTIDFCQSFFKYLYTFENPMRIFIAVLLLTVLVYIPTNYFLSRYE